MEHKITIMTKPISQNSDSWRSLWLRREYKKHLQLEAWVLIKEAKVKSMERVHLSAVAYFPDHRHRDLDNYHAPIFKAVQDALVDAGVIPADDTRHIPELPGLRFDYDKANPRTEITITELEGDE